MIRFNAAHGSYAFDPKKVIGKPGKFSTLYKGINELDQSEVVIKALRAEAPDELNWPVDHPAFVPEIDRALIHERTIIVRPYIKGLTVDQWVKSIRIRRQDDFDKLLVVLLEITTALEALHHSGYIHGDIRRHNILISTNGDKQAVVRIIDAGLLRRFDDRDRAAKLPFSLLYSPPEQVLRCEGLDGPHSDLYSLALCIYELLSAQPPFQTSNPELLIHLMCVKALEAHEGISPELFHFLQKATNRYAFPKPPGLYEREELYQLLKLGIAGRYHSAAEFASALRENWKIAERKGGIFGFLKY